MSPRAGGEAAKFGARFEGRWTVRNLLDVLLGNAHSVVVEAVDDNAESVEFFVNTLGGEQGHQVKRQWKNNRTWPVTELKREGILGDALAHVNRGREFHFVSTLPSRELDELSDIARRSDTFHAFTSHVSSTSQRLRNAADLLSDEWKSPEASFEALKRVFVWSPDERQLHADNLAFADWLIDGPPEAATSVLAQLAQETLTVTLTRDRIWTELENRGLRPNPLHDDTTIAGLVADQTDRWVHGIKRELLEPPISRQETAVAVEHLRSAEAPLMVVGGAGFGKSAVAAAVVEAVRQDGWPVLAFRLDRHTDVRSARQLGQELDLPTTPVLALATVAQGADALLVCDQLDAVSLASGRSTGVFDVVDELLRQKEHFPRLRVMFACRSFDIENDRRLSALTDAQNPQHAETVTVAPLSDQAINAAVAEIGLDETKLNETQRDLLRSPLNLVLLREVAGQEEALGFQTVRELMELYWRTKRREAAQRRLPQETRFEAVVARLVEAMSASQLLSVPETVLYKDGLDDDAAVLVSEHVIVHEGGRYAFFHEALFDHAFARAWLSENRTVLEFLIRGEQELFRRGQTRQVLTYFRDGDPARFAREARDLLTSDEVRFHVKDVVLSLLRALPDPSSEDRGLVLDLLDGDYAWRDRVELLLRTSPWFDRLYEDGIFAQWLASGDTRLEGLAVTTIGTAGRDRPDQVAELLEPHQSHADFAGWLLWAARFIDLETSRAMVELVLSALRSGSLDGREHDLWLSAHTLGEKRPTWAVELLSAWLIERPASSALADGRVIDMAQGDHSLLEVVRQAADGAPEAFVSTLLPYMLRVMEVASVGEHVLLGDWHFGSRIINSHISELDDALLYAMQAALAKVAADAPERLRELIEPLASDPHQGAQNLLYEALIAAGPAHADWAGDLLLRGGPALESGYSDDYRWTTRQLIQATAAHMSDDRYERLEGLLLAYVPDYERSKPGWRGHAAFTLLSAVPEGRLSERGSRELEILRRKFGRDQPEAPRGIVGGIVGSPIRTDAAVHMTDDQWLGAMRRYAGPEDRDLFAFTGGTFELASQVLQPATRADPERFAQLGLRIDGSYNSAYLDAILMGLGDAEVDCDPDLVYGLVRHASMLGTNRRWLGYALKKFYSAEIPADIIQILIDEATRVPTQASPDMGDPYMSGINGEQGTHVHTLAILLSYDETGDRARLVEPAMDSLLASTDSGTRTTLAELLRALLPWNRARAVGGFRTLAESGDIDVFTTRQFEELAAAVLLTDIEAARPAIQMLLHHDDEEAREHGARLATFAATDAGEDELLAPLVASEDTATRRGTASVLADRVRWVHTDVVTQSLSSLFSDPDQSVREASARFVAHLRDVDLEPYESLLHGFLGSPAFEDEVAQVGFTLDLDRGDAVTTIILFARRYLELFGREVGDIQTRAAGDAREVGRLVVQSYGRTEDAELRRELLDIIDRLLELNAYGLNEAVERAER